MSIMNAIKQANFVINNYCNCGDEEWRCFTRYISHSTLTLYTLCRTALWHFILYVTQHFDTLYFLLHSTLTLYTLCHIALWHFILYVAQHFDTLYFVSHITLTLYTLYHIAFWHLLHYIDSNFIITWAE